MKKAAVVVSVAKLLETLAEVEDLEAPVVPRCQKVRHLNKRTFSDGFERARAKEREIVREIGRARERERE